MEFGRLPSVDDVDFTLPRESPANERVLARGAGEARVRLGLPGWSDRGFVGRLYPRGTRTGDFLGHYGRAFSTHELNSTYYGVTPERIERWAAAVPADFRFCPKLPQAITHGNELRGVEREMERFLELLPGFDGRLGRIWGILPPDFGPHRFEDLAEFVERYAARVPLALELRHRDWFRSGGDEVFSLFEEHGVLAVLTDVAGRRDVLHMRLTVPEVLLRFVGNTPHESDSRRIEDWVERVARWCEAGLETAYLFMHQKHDPDAVELVRAFARGFEGRIGVDPLPGLPGPHLEARQGELFLD